LRRLAAIAGLDVAQGLERMAGNAPGYVRLIRMMADTGGDMARQLADAIAAADLAALEYVAHDLKGMAGNLGAVKVEEGASVLAAALRARSESSTLVSLGKALLAVLVHLIEDVQAALR
jgi:HPt (histidine-containing phosphotransfer) domain-containing protein